MRIFLSLAITATAVTASNPLVPNVGMADPHVHVFNNNFYMYATHDFADNNTGFKMTDWWTWSSSDLVSWTKTAVVTPDQTPASKGSYDECWATDGAVSSNGSYFFYLSMGPNEVGVMQSDTSPGGPWYSPLTTPLINASLGPSLNPPTTSRDPCVFEDVDGQHYIIFGVFQYYIAKLTTDLVALAESPKFVTVLNPTGPYGNSTDDKPFLHKRLNPTTGAVVYYLSWGCFYSTGDSPYGPFTYQGTYLTTQMIDPSFRMNVTDGPWYGWEDYADRHGSYWTFNNQNYVSMNDRSHSSDTAHPDVYRDTVLAYVNYYDNGTMAYVRVDATGVGEYNAQKGIEAEDYFHLYEKKQQEKQEEEGGGSIMSARKGHSLFTLPDAVQPAFGVRYITKNTVLVYNHVRQLPNSNNNKNNMVFSIKYANGGNETHTLLVYASFSAPSSNLHLLCKIQLQPTGGWGDQDIMAELQQYATASCDINMDLPNELDVLELRFEQTSSYTNDDSNSIVMMELARLDSMVFTTRSGGVK